MNNVKTYISQVKSFFPVIGKSERKYINTLEQHILDETAGERPTLDYLYEYYGYPSSVVYTYFSTMNTSEIIRKLNVSRLIKRAILIIISIIIFVSAIWSARLYYTYKVFSREEAVLVKDVIE